MNDDDNQAKPPGKPIPDGPDEQHAHPSELIGEVILGLNDGIVTTLVFALSVSGASPGAYPAVVVAGLAEMLAGGVSMFLGGYRRACRGRCVRLSGGRGAS